METTSTKRKSRPIEISIFQTSIVRPPGIKIQLLLVMSTFVTCFFLALMGTEKKSSHQEVVAQKKHVKPRPNYIKF